MRLTLGWHPNTNYIDVMARERHRVKLIEISNKAIQIPTIYIKEKHYLGTAGQPVKVGMDFYYCLPCKLNQLDLMNSNKTVIYNIMQKCHLSYCYQSCK